MEIWKVDLKPEGIPLGLRYSGCVQRLPGIEVYVLSGGVAHAYTDWQPGEASARREHTQPKSHS